MPKDYARTRPKPRQHKAAPRKHNSGNGLPGWLWALVGLTTGLAIAAIAFIIMRPVEPQTAVTTPPPAAIATPAPAPGPQIPPQQKPRFGFYEGLPKAQVRPSEEAYKVEKLPQTDNDKFRYVVQAGSFRASKDAERRKANLTLLGFEPSVKQASVEGKGTRYRVQIGSSMTREEAEKAMRRLADHDIDSYPTRTDS